MTHTVPDSSPWGDSGAGSPVVLVLVGVERLPLPI
jgi:hypothetical protein